MKAPQILMIGWLLFGLLVSATQHGKPKTGVNNVWYSIVGAAIYVTLLLWGGYFHG